MKKFKERWKKNKKWVMREFFTRPLKDGFKFFLWVIILVIVGKYLIDFLVVVWRPVIKALFSGLSEVSTIGIAIGFTFGIFYFGGWLYRILRSPFGILLRRVGSKIPIINLFVGRKGRLFSILKDKPIGLLEVRPGLFALGAVMKTIKLLPPENYQGLEKNPIKTDYNFLPSSPTPFTGASIFTLEESGPQDPKFIPLKIDIQDVLPIITSIGLGGPDEIPVADEKIWQELCERIKKNKQAST